MIEKVRALVWDNRDTFLPTCVEDPVQLSISLFNHGRILPWSKVLFLVTYKRSLLCIVKTAYSTEHLERIEQEYKAQASFADEYNSITIPRAFFSGIIDGRFFYAEEVCLLPTHLNPEGQQLLEGVLAYQTEQKVLQEIDIRVIRECFERHLPPPVMDKFRSDIVKLRSTLRYAHTHGDFTPRNVVRNTSGRLTVIDWERAGERPFWGIDLCHYLIRVFGKCTHDEFRDTLTYVNKHHQGRLDVAYFLDLYTIDMVFDALEKYDYVLYRKAVEDIKTRL